MPRAAARRIARSAPPARRAELDRFSAACRDAAEFAGMVQHLFDRLLPRAQDDERRARESLDALLRRYGFDRVQHEQIQADLRAGRIGLAQNRLPAASRIEDVRARRRGRRAPSCERYRGIGEEALAAGAVAVVIARRRGRAAAGPRARAWSRR